MTRYVYRFGGGVSDGEAGNRNLLGGKGANLAEMASIGLPVPPGFTISTEMCARYYAEGEAFPDSLRAEVADGIAHIEQVTGRRFGDAADPLLVSVRSGARVSMPGMMDTVLNLGLNDETVEGLAETSGDARFAWDSYRRFIQMYANVVLGLRHDLFEEALEIAKEDKGVHLDTELGAEDWGGWSSALQGAGRGGTGQALPAGPARAALGRDRRGVRLLDVRPGEDLSAAERHPRATGAPRSTSRRWCSATWARPRPPASPSPAIPRPASGLIMANILINAQGEDVVAGIRTPQYLTRAARDKAGAKAPSMEETMPEVFAELARVFDLLERHYRDMQDIEFTVERGKLWMLQTRTGKRTAKAALRIAVDMANEGLIGEEEAVLRVDPAALDQLLHPTLDPSAERCHRQGPARLAGRRLRQGGVRRRHRRKRAAGGEQVILVRIETSAPRTFTACTPPRASSPRAAA
jgi:pyruvate,orthophosphate dikinase